jgi:hypothetical protein
MSGRVAVISLCCEDVIRVVTYTSSLAGIGAVSAIPIGAARR